MINQIDHLAIAVADLERSRKFIEILGFEEAIRSILVMDSRNAASSGRLFDIGSERAYSLNAFLFRR